MIGRKYALDTVLFKYLGLRTTDASKFVDQPFGVARHHSCSYIPTHIKPISNTSKASRHDRQCYMNMSPFHRSNWLGVLGRGGDFRSRYKFGLKSLVPVDLVEKHSSRDSL